MKMSRLNADAVSGLPVRKKRCLTLLETMKRSADLNLLDTLQHMVNQLRGSLRNKWAEKVYRLTSNWSKLSFGELAKVLPPLAK